MRTAKIICFGVAGVLTILAFALFALGIWEDARATMTGVLAIIFAFLWAAVGAVFAGQEAKNAER